MKLRPAFKIHGGKYYVADFIIDHFPHNYEKFKYIEPFCGAANVLLRKKISCNELINDIHEGSIAILRNIKENCSRFTTKLKTIEYNLETFNKAIEHQPNSQFDLAINEFILRRMSRGGLKKAFAWSNRKRNNLPGDVNAWNTILDQLYGISERLRNVEISNTTAIKTVEDNNNESVLIYADPPYDPASRVSANAYDFEMTKQDHMDLFSLFQNHKGKIIVSGYRSSLYNDLYGGWNMYTKNIVNHASQAKKKKLKEECIWCNF